MKSQDLLRSGLALVSSLALAPSVAGADAFLYVQNQFTGATTNGDVATCPSVSCLATEIAATSSGPATGFATGTVALGAGLSMSSNITRTSAGPLTNVNNVALSFEETFTLSGPDTSLFLVDASFGFLLDGLIQVPVGPTYGAGRVRLDISVSQGNLPGTMIPNILVDLESTVTVLNDGSIIGSGLLFDLATQSPGQASWSNPIVVPVPGLATNAPAHIDIDLTTRLWDLGSFVDFDSTFETDPLAPFVIDEGPAGDYLLTTSAGDASAGGVSFVGDLETEATVLQPTTPLPEPGPLLLGALGLAGLRLRARRRLRSL